MDTDKRNAQVSKFGRTAAVAIVVVSMLVSLVWIAGPTSATEYAVTDLGVVSGESSAAWQMNNNGQIVGESGDHAFLWESGLMVELKPLGMPGAQETAHDINDYGVVVGYASLNGVDHACVWESGTITSLPDWGAGSAAFGINNAGQIVGRAEGLDGMSHAVLWEAGAITDLGTLGGDSVATKIGENGQIVGCSHIDDTAEHACLWDSGTITDLETLGSTYSIAMGINERGQIVGRTEVTPGIAQAFIWEAGAMSLLPAVSYEQSAASDINENGVIVGTGIGAGNYAAVLWDSGTVTYLEAIGGGRMAMATAIDDSGNIAGASAVYDTVHASLWQPTIKPAPTLDVAIDSGDLYFRGEQVEFYALASVQGIAIETSSMTMEVIDPNGVSTALSPEMVSTGLYKAVFAIPVDAPDGTYALIVAASAGIGSETAQGTALKCFQISAMMADWADSLKSLHPLLVDIQGKTAIIETDLGEVKADVKWINATIYAVWGNKVKIKTTVGEIVVDASKVDMDYFPWAVEPKKGVDPAMYVGMAVLAMSLFAAGAMTRSPIMPGHRSSRRKSN